MKTLQDRPIPIRVKLAALWTGTMFCYVYGDYFGLYVPSKLEAIARGSLGPIGAATPGALVGVALMMAIPGILITATFLIPAHLCRWSSIIFGGLYTGIVAISMPGAEPFYITLSCIEMMMTAAIVVVGVTWPTDESHPNER